MICNNLITRKKSHNNFVKITGLKKDLIQNCHVNISFADHRQRKFLKCVNV